MKYHKSLFLHILTSALKIPCGKPQGILMQGIIFYYIRSLDPVATAGNTLAIHLFQNSFIKCFALFTWMLAECPDLWSGMKASYLR